MKQKQVIKKPPHGDKPKQMIVTKPKPVISKPIFVQAPLPKPRAPNVENVIRIASIPEKKPDISKLAVDKDRTKNLATYAPPTRIPIPAPVQSTQSLAVDKDRTKNLATYAPAKTKVDAPRPIAISIDPEKNETRRGDSPKTSFSKIKSDETKNLVKVTVKPDIRTRNDIINQKGNKEVFVSKELGKTLPSKILTKTKFNKHIKNFATETGTTQTAIAKDKKGKYGTYTSVNPHNSGVKGNAPIKTTLSPATIKAQQELSDKFGISTFGIKGDISTVPTIESGGFSDINVGFGNYGNMNDYAKAAIEKQVATYQMTNPASTEPITVSSPAEPTRYNSGLDLNSVKSQLMDNLPLVAVALVGLFLLTGRKRR